MSKTQRKPVNGSKKVTDYFSKTSGTSSSPSPSSQDATGRSYQQLAPFQPTQSQKVNAPPMKPSQVQISDLSLLKSRHVGKPPPDVISVSSGSGAPSHITISSGSRSHITISSDSSSPVVIADPNKARQGEPTPVRKVFKPRMGAPQTITKTTVKRRQKPPPERSFKRKLEVDSDSDVPTLDKIPYPLSSAVSEKLAALPLNTSRTSLAVSKRTRLTPSTASKPPTTSSPMFSGNEADEEDVIPSSQSDEQELTASKPLVKDPVQTRQHVDEWRRATLGSDCPTNDRDSRELLEVPMDVDIDPCPHNIVDMLTSEPAPVLCQGSIEDVPTSEAEVSAGLRSPQSFSAAPVPQSDPPAPSTPVRQPSTDKEGLFEESFSPQEPDSFMIEDVVPSMGTSAALDTAEKTRQLIAEIRAGVAAGITSSPEPETRAFQDELESSDDAPFDDDIFGFRAGPKDSAAGLPSSPLSSVPTSPLPADDEDEDEDEDARRRYQSRRRSSTRITSHRLPQPAVPQAGSRRTTTFKKQTDPLEELLKEKRKNDQRGQGSDALAAAEAFAASAVGRRKSRTSSPREIDLKDEDAAMRIVYERATGRPLKSSTSRLGSDGESDDEDDEDDSNLFPADYEKLLGEGGKIVGRIIEQDKELERTKKSGKSRVARGVPFWIPKAGGSSAGRKRSRRSSSSFPSLTEVNFDSDPFLAPLKRCSDPSLIAQLLRPECLSRVQPTHRTPLFDWLFSISFSFSDPTAMHTPFETLKYIPDCFGSSITLSHEQVLSTLLYLGASPNALETAGWSPPTPMKQLVEQERRPFLLSYLVSLIVTYSQRNCVSTDSTPDMILTLLVIALDISTPPDVQREIRVGVDDILANIDATKAGHQLEAAIAARVFRYMSKLELINIVHLLSFLNRGSQQNRRIARSLARSSLLRNDDSPELFLALPPLQPLLTLLSPSAGSEAPFDIAGNAEKPGYFEQLGYNVELLSIALTDVEEYVKLEAKTPRVEPLASPLRAVSGSPKKGCFEKSTTELETIKTLLDMHHGKIVDTRAAHLDRSRVKAALQHLSFRVYYQRQAYLRSGTVNKQPRNIQAYFGTPVSK